MGHPARPGAGGGGAAERLLRLDRPRDDAQQPQAGALPARRDHPAQPQRHRPRLHHGGGRQGGHPAARAAARAVSDVHRPRAALPVPAKRRAPPFARAARLRHGRGGADVPHPRHPSPIRPTPPSSPLRQNRRERHAARHRAVPRRGGGRAARRADDRGGSRRASAPCSTAPTARRSARCACACCARRGETLSVAESCTGGLLASAIVDNAGSSACFFEGAVTYSNEAKMRRLGVTRETLDGARRGQRRLRARDGRRHARRRRHDLRPCDDRHRRPGRRHGGKAGGPCLCGACLPRRRKGRRSSI